jgi:hypothetical protein
VQHHAQVQDFQKHLHSEDAGEDIIKILEDNIPGKRGVEGRV